MKQIHKYFIVLLLLPALFLGSCEEVTELDPYNQVSDVTAFTTPSLVELSVIGMYNAAQRGYFNGSDFRGYPFGAATIQQGDNRAEDAVNQQAFYRFTYEGTYDPTTANNVYYWQDTYRLINRTNIIIEGVQKALADGVITDEVAKKYEGEAKLMRAISYHELLVYFARPYKHTADASHLGVPYQDKAMTNVTAIEEGKAKKRESVKVVYEKILADLDFAEANLPTKAGWAAANKVARATKGAAMAYKTRVYQHMYNWDKVIAEGEKLVSSGEYALGAEPWTVFTNNYANSEYIFVMQNSGTNNPGVNAAIASQYLNRRLVAISPIVWRNEYWRDDDKRRKEPEMTQRFATGIYTTKYKDVTNYSDATPLIRYAEVLLNLAEAYAYKNDLTNSLKYLNMVRNRSLADPATQAYTSFADANDIMGAILAERRIELAMEGRRWPDVHRLQHSTYHKINGIPAKVGNLSTIPAAYYDGEGIFGSKGEPYGVAAIPYDNFKFIWPIPLVEINANPSLADQQNPGY